MEKCTAKETAYSQMEYILGSGPKVKDQAKENFSSRKVICMKEIGKIIFEKVVEFSSTPMEISMKAVGKMICAGVTVRYLTVKAADISANGKKIRNMAKEITFLQMATNIKVSSRGINRKERASIRTLRVTFIQEISRITNSKVKAVLL